MIEALKPSYADKDGYKILEMGPGPSGNSTSHFATTLPNATITAVESDKKAILPLTRVLNQQAISNVSVLNESILNHQPPVPYDAFVACGAFTDIKADARPGFYEQIKNPHFLKPGGVFMIEEEVLPTFFTLKLNERRTKALWKHHGNVILDAIFKDKPDLAYNELQALFSGLKGVGDFKNSLSGFLTELNDAGFDQSKVSWKKIWPLKHHLIAQQRILSLNLTKAPSESWKNNKKLSRVWDYYTIKILRAIIEAKKGNISDSHFKEAFQAIIDFHKLVKENNCFYIDNLKLFQQRVKSNLGLKLICGQDLTDPKDDKTGGVFVYTVQV